MLSENVLKLRKKQIYDLFIKNLLIKEWHKHSSYVLHCKCMLYMYVLEKKYQFLKIIRVLIYKTNLFFFRYIIFSTSASSKKNDVYLNCHKICK